MFIDEVVERIVHMFKITKQGRDPKQTRCMALNSSKKVFKTRNKGTK